MAAEPQSLFKSFVVAVDVIAAIGMAVLFVLGFADPGSVGIPAARLGERAITLPLETTEAKSAFGVAVAVLGLNLVWLLWGRRLRRPVRFVQSDLPVGPVKVARDAIESGLRAAGEALEEVTRMRVVVENAGMKRLRVKAQFQAPEGASVHEASRNLRQALEHRFHEMVHLGEGARVDWEIEFVGFQGKAQKKDRDKLPGTAPLEPFTGPRYPIDDEEPYGDKKHS